MRLPESRPLPAESFARAGGNGFARNPPINGAKSTSDSDIVGENDA